VFRADSQRHLSRGGAWKQEPRICGESLGMLVHEPASGRITKRFEARTVLSEARTVLDPERNVSGCPVESIWG
jgi:hypothetical protein